MKSSFVQRPWQVRRIILLKYAIFLDRDSSSIAAARCKSRKEVIRLPLRLNLLAVYSAKKQKRLNVNTNSTIFRTAFHSVIICKRQISPSI